MLWCTVNVSTATRALRQNERRKANDAHMDRRSVSRQCSKDEPGVSLLAMRARPCCSFSRCTILLHLPLAYPKTRDHTATPAITMVDSYEDDFIETFPQHQQPLEAQHVTQLESRDNAAKYTVLLAIICILVVQFGGTFTSWIRHLREQGLMNVIWDLWVQMWVRLLAILDTAKLFVSSFPSSNLDSSPSVTVRRRRVLEALSNLPELEDAEYSYDAEEKKEQETKETQYEEQNGVTKMKRLNEEELEPAFLREEDYPPEWMVYDCKLGVILKTEADKHRSKAAGCIKGAQTRETRCAIEEIPAVTSVLPQSDIEPIQDVASVPRGDNEQIPDVASVPRSDTEQISAVA